MSRLGRIFHRDRDDEAEDLSVYKDEPATSRLTSFLFGFFALLVTLLIAAGLFFGARAIYRALDGNSKDDTATTQKAGDTAQPKDTAKKKKSSKQSSGASSSGDDLPSTGDTLPNTGDTPRPESLPKTGDPGM